MDCLWPKEQEEDEGEKEQKETTEEHFQSERESLSIKLVGIEKVVRLVGV